MKKLQLCFAMLALSMTTHQVLAEVMTVKNEAHGKIMVLISDNDFVRDIKATSIEQGKEYRLEDIDTKDVFSLKHEPIKNVKVVGWKTSYKPGESRALTCLPAVVSITQSKPVVVCK